MNIITGGLLQAMDSITGDNGRWPLNGLHVNGPRLTASDGRLLCIVTFPKDVAARPITVEGRPNWLKRTYSYIIRERDPEDGLNLIEPDKLDEKLAPEGIDLPQMKGQYPDLKHHREEWMDHKARTTCEALDIDADSLSNAADSLSKAADVFNHCELAASWANGRVRISVHDQPSPKADRPYMYMSAKPEEEVPMTVEKIQLILV